MSIWQKMFYYLVVKPIEFFFKMFQWPIRNFTYLFTRERVHNTATQEDADAFAKTMWVRLVRDQYQRKSKTYKVQIEVGSTSDRQVNCAFYHQFSLPGAEVKHRTSYNFGKSFHVFAETKLIPEELYVFHERTYNKVIPDPTAVTAGPKRFPTAEELFPEE